MERGVGGERGRYRLPKNRLAAITQRGKELRLVFMAFPVYMYEVHAHMYI